MEGGGREGGKPTFETVLEDVFHDHKEVSELDSLVADRLPEIHAVGEKGLEDEFEDVEQVLALLGVLAELVSPGGLANHLKHGGKLNGGNLRGELSGQLGR